MGPEGTHMPAKREFRLGLWLAMSTLALLVVVRVPAGVSPRMAATPRNKQDVVPIAGAVKDAVSSGAASASPSVSDAPSRGPIAGQSLNNDVSPPLRAVKPLPVARGAKRAEREDPGIPAPAEKKYVKDPVVQDWFGP